MLKEVGGEDEREEKEGVEEQKEEEDDKEGDMEEEEKEVEEKDKDKEGKKRRTYLSRALEYYYSLETGCDGTGTGGTGN